MMNAIGQILEEHDQVDASGLPVRFTKITAESYVLEVFAYVLTADYNRYLEVQSELLLKIMDAASRLGVGFAVPFQESVAAATVFGVPGMKNQSAEINPRR